MSFLGNINDFKRKVDGLDKLVDKVKTKLDTDKIKQKVDEISADAWTKIQESVLDDKTKEAKEAFDLISSIFDKLKEFYMPEIAFKLPKPLLLLLIKIIQDYESKNLNFSYT